MRSLGRVLLCLAALACVGLIARPLMAAAPAAPATKAGFAERDITPDIGMEQPGGYGKSFHRIFHDSCKARAAVFDDGRRRVAIVGIDAAFIRRPYVAACRKAIEEKCRIRPECVLVAASHSHSSGPTGMVIPGEYDHASPLVQDLAYKKSSCADPVYMDRVVKAIVEAVSEADARREEALCGVGKGIEDKVAYNRRLRMKNGMTFTHPRQGNPDIVEPAGPTDPEVGVVGAWSKKDGRLLGCLVNFACHATTSPGGISANYIHYLDKTVRGALGEEAVVVFLAGASGDVTQVDNLSPYRAPVGEAWAQLVGGRVGAEAVKVLLSMPRGELLPVDGKIATLSIQRRVPDPQRVKRCLEIVQQDPKRADATEYAFAKEIVMLDATLKTRAVADVEVQAIQVGPAVFLANPAEYFCQYGLDIKAKSPFPFTFPVSLANDACGYVPTQEAFGPHGGGYETRLTSYSNLVPAAGQEMADAELALARQMKPGEAPKPLPAPEFKAGGAWTYGSVPPELR